MSEGIPTPDENNFLFNIEETVFEELERENLGYMSNIVTTSGFKEFVIYHNEEFEINDVMRKLQSAFGEYKFTTYTKEDREWIAYGELGLGGEK